MSSSNALRVTDAGLARPDAPAARAFPAATPVPEQALQTLVDWPLRTAARIVEVACTGAPGHPGKPLRDLGFMPGESVRVVARAWPGGDPLVVQVGSARFALRAAEAACVRVDKAQ